MATEREMLQYLQNSMWDQLAGDLRSAIGGYWSMASESTVTRIVWIARMVGVSNAGGISIPLVKSGVYEAVCYVTNVAPVIDFDLNMYEQHWGDYLGLAQAVPRIRAMEVEEFVYE